MNWPVFVVQVILGGTLGIFAARAYFWKRKAREWRLLYEAELDLNQSIARSPLPPNHALLQALKQAGVPQLPPAQQLISNVKMTDSITDDVLERILRDLEAQPVPFVIQEES